MSITQSGFKFISGSDRGLPLLYPTLGKMMREPLGKTQDTRQRGLGIGMRLLTNSYRHIMTLLVLIAKCQPGR